MIPHVSKLIINMEGVLWHGETPMTGLEAFINLLLESDVLEFLLETNNSGLLPQDYANKLARFGLTVPPEQILTAGEVTTQYLKKQYPPGTPIYLIGEKGLSHPLKEAQFHILSEKEAHYTTAEVVVVGIDREVTYEKMATAATHIKRGADFIATNPDTNLPADGSVRPSTGSIIAFIQTACGIPPRIVGKPNRMYFQEALNKLNCGPQEVAFIGDSLTTDIGGAKEAGLYTILQLSGLTSAHEARMSHIQADVMFPDLRALTEEVRQLEAKIAPEL